MRTPAATQTQLYARSLRRDALARLVAIALRHFGKGLPMSSRQYFNEGVHLFESGESAYLTRRAFLHSVACGAGTSHPDYEYAWTLVRMLDAAETAALGVAA